MNGIHNQPCADCGGDCKLECEYGPTYKNPAAVALGSIKSEKKATASKENGKLGGRPKTLKATEARKNKVV